MLNPTIEREIWIAAPITRVWEAIANTEHYGRWWGGAESVRILDLRVGGSIDFATSDGVISATITCLEPPRVLQYQWPTHPRYFGVAFVTTYTLREHEGGVRLTFVESGFSAWPHDAERRERYERLQEGFAALLDRLKLYLEEEAGA